MLPEDLVEPHRARGDLIVLRGSGVPLLDSVWLNGVPGGRGGLARQTLRAALIEGLG